MLEDYTFVIYLNLIDPPTTKFRFQTFASTAVHNAVQGTPTAAGTRCVFDCDENFDAHDPFAGVRLQLQALTYQGTGGTVTDLRVREDLRLCINAFYRRDDGTVPMRLLEVSRPPGGFWTPTSAVLRSGIVLGALQGRTRPGTGSAEGAR